MLARDALSAVRNSTPLRTENQELRTRLLINSRTDVALAAGADGVHLRSDDIGPHEVRHVLEASAHRPPATDHFLVAASCHSAADVFRAESENADFAVFAPVFEKKDAPLFFLKTTTQPTGLAALREACRAKIRVLALGGVTVENAASCLNAGAAGVAGIRLFQEKTSSARCGRSDPQTRPARSSIPPEFKYADYGFRVACEAAATALFTMEGGNAVWAV
jgi:thiamine-phosphate pyrophosphorylase